MTSKDICIEMHWRELAMYHDLELISKYHTKRCDFGGYSEEQLQEMIEMLEDALSDAKSLRDFMNQEYTEKTGA